MYQPPAVITSRPLVQAQCDDFRRGAEEKSGQWSLGAYVLALLGTGSIAAGSAEATATDDKAVRVASISIAAAGTLMLAVSKGAFESSFANSAAAASAARAMKDGDAVTMNNDCLQADADLRLAKRNEINSTAPALTAPPTPTSTVQPSASTAPPPASPAPPQPPPSAPRP